MRRPFHIMYDMYLVIKNNFAWNPLPHWMSKISFSIYLSYRHLNAGIRMSLTVFRQKHLPSPLVHLQGLGQRVKPACMAQPFPVVFLDGLYPTRIEIECMIGNRKKVRKVIHSYLDAVLMGSYLLCSLGCHHLWIQEVYQHPPANPLWTSCGIENLSQVPAQWKNTE